MTAALLFANECNLFRGVVFNHNNFLVKFNPVNTITLNTNICNDEVLLEKSSTKMESIKTSPTQVGCYSSHRIGFWYVQVEKQYDAFLIQAVLYVYDLRKGV